MSLKDFFYTIYDDVTRNYTLFRSKKSKVHGIILMYHHVISDESMPLGSCVCTVDEFKNSLDEIAKHGYKFVSIDEANKIIKQGCTIKFASITFDDVPDNFYDNAYPVLKVYNYPFALFITTSYLVKSGYLNSKQVSYLSKDPLCTIGAHTMTHPVLRKSGNAKMELQGAKIELERLTGYCVKYLAYPYGKKSSVSNRVTRVAAECGYEAAFGTEETPVSDYSLKNPYNLPRVVYQRGNFYEIFEYRMPIGSIILNKIRKYFE